MINIAPLYIPIKHRYKGVYPGPGPDQWDAIVTTPAGKFVRKGRFPSQEEAARTVATYYLETLGPRWAELIQNKNRMRRNWRVKKVVRFLHMTSLYRGPRTTVYAAEVEVKERQWKRVTPEDMLQVVDKVVIDMMWNPAAEGWVSSSAAVVAIRMYRKAQPVPASTSPGES